jgi:hypothetical protein
VDRGWNGFEADARESLYALNKELTRILVSAQREELSVNFNFLSESLSIHGREDYSDEVLDGNENKVLELEERSS